MESDSLSVRRPARVTILEDVIRQLAEALPINAHNEDIFLFSMQSNIDEPSCVWRKGGNLEALRHQERLPDNRFTGGIERKFVEMGSHSLLNVEEMLAI